MQVFVRDEFSPLRRVVVAQSQLKLPRDFSETRFLDDVSAFDPSTTGGQWLEHAFPEKQKKWESERAELVAVLEEHGVDVLRPRLLTAAERDASSPAGISNFFVRDPFFTIGDTLIEGSMRFAHRRDEVLPSRPIIAEQAHASGATYVAVPRPDTSEGADSEVGPFLEGGDVLVNGPHVFVGSSGLASNAGGVSWLSDLLRHKGYTVEQVPLDPDVLHLDCALSLVREGLMIVSEEALTQGIPDSLKDWDRIVVPLESVKHLTVNGLPISPETYVTDPAFEGPVGRELEKRGITVRYVDFSVSRSLGGSFRCSTQALLRL